MIRGREPKNINALMEEYQCPDVYKKSTLKHGEMTMDLHLLYEYSQYGDTDEMRQCFLNASNTFYRRDVLLDMPHIAPLRDISDELQNTYLISKNRRGFVCPNCGSTDTTMTYIQLRSLDEAQDRFLVCYSCDVKTKNPNLKVSDNIE